MGALGGGKGTEKEAKEEKGEKKKGSDHHSLSKAAGAVGGEERWRGPPVPPRRRPRGEEAVGAKGGRGWVGGWCYMATHTTSFLRLIPTTRR